jgi:hypothetical protein
MPEREFLKLQEEIETLKAELAAVKRDSAIRPRAVLRRLLGNPRVRIGLVVAVAAIPLAAYAAQISVPYDFVNGTVADATEVNANFDALEAESNGQDNRITTVENDLTLHQAAPSAHHDKTTDFADLTSGMATDTQVRDDITINQATFASVSGNSDTLDGLDSTDFSPSGHDHDDRYYSKAHVDALEVRIADLEATLSGVSRGGTPDTLTFSGMNVQVNDGSGGTGGAVNGLGNLIVGYNENNYSATRTGSHNLVVGIDHEYTSFAGLVAGRRNTISGSNSSVSGGYQNTASGSRSSVCGGQGNDASAMYSSAIGPVPTLTITGN